MRLADDAATEVRFNESELMAVLDPSPRAWADVDAHVDFEGEAAAMDPCESTESAFSHAPTPFAPSRPLEPQPLNALVVLGTKLAGWANTAEQLQQVFMVVVGMQTIALVMQLVIYFFFPPPAPEKLNDIVKDILDDEEDAGDKTAQKKQAMGMAMKKTAEAKNKSPRKKSGGRAKSGSRSPKKKQ